MIATAAGWRTRGHPAATAAVQRAVRDGRPPHALVIAGPGGVGKTTLALDLARGLLCTDRLRSSRPCGACAACRRVDHGNHPDLHLLAPDGPGGQIRLPGVQRLMAELSLMPMEGLWRVAIIEAAHRLNPDAQNALLKTLEEPVGAVCIVLAADDVAALLPTVLSRAARIRLGAVPAAIVADLLADRDLADASRSAEIARLAAGRPGIAVAMAAQPESLLTVDRLARSLLDLSTTDRRGRLAAVDGLLADGASLTDPEGGASTRVRATPAERRRAALRVLGAWRDVGRDLALVARGGAAQVRHLALLEDLRVIASLIPHDELLRFLGRLDAHIVAIEEYANPELTLDVLVLSWPSVTGAVDHTA